jgi:uncharacterized membrane protein YdjX (TVP38/TMEM64 family)
MNALCKQRYARLPLQRNLSNLAAMTVASDHSNKRILLKLALLLIPAGIAALGVYSAWSTHPDPAHWQQLGNDARSYLEARPLLLLIVLATLPGVGFPMSPLLILFGIVMSPRFGLPITCVSGIAATSICTVWSYLLAAGPLRLFLKKHLLHKWTLPELTQHNALRLGLIIRITPGIPYPLQNVALGVMGLRFKTYLLASLPVQSLYTMGFIVTGGAIFEGKVGLALTGGGLLVVVILASRMLRNRTTRHVG